MHKFYDDTRDLWFVWLLKFKWAECCGRHEKQAD